MKDKQEGEEGGRGRLIVSGLMLVMEYGETICYVHTCLHLPVCEGSHHSAVAQCSYTYFKNHGRCDVVCP